MNSNYPEIPILAGYSSDPRSPTHKEEKVSCPNCGDVGWADDLLPDADGICAACQLDSQKSCVHCDSIFPLDCLDEDSLCEVCSIYLASHEELEIGDLTHWVPPTKEKDQ